MNLTKLHGLGNDFLVVLESAQSSPLVPSAELAACWCDRHTGIGADGVLWGRNGDSESELRMTLHNADGSEAEISGNGIRCLAHAALRSSGRRVGSITVATAVGPRNVEVAMDATGTTATCSVDMGGVVDGPAFGTDDLRAAAIRCGLEQVGLGRVASRSIGNPHVVVELDPDVSFDEQAAVAAALGSEIDRTVPGGTNVHLLTILGSEEIRLTHWERGAGLTRACGSGACVSAVVARQWGAVCTTVHVAMPGGLATVVVDGADAMLIGPSVVVADMTVPVAQVTKTALGPVDSGVPGEVG